MPHLASQDKSTQMAADCVDAVSHVIFEAAKTNACTALQPAMMHIADFVVTSILPDAASATARYNLAKVAHWIRVGISCKDFFDMAELVQGSIKKKYKKKHVTPYTDFLIGLHVQGMIAAHEAGEKALGQQIHSDLVDLVRNADDADVSLSDVEWLKKNLKSGTAKAIKACKRKYPYDDFSEEALDFLSPQLRALEDKPLVKELKEMHPAPEEDDDAASAAAADESGEEQAAEEEDATDYCFTESALKAAALALVGTDDLDSLLQEGEEEEGEEGGTSFAEDETQMLTEAAITPAKTPREKKGKTPVKQASASSTPAKTPGTGKVKKAAGKSPAAVGKAAAAAVAQLGKAVKHMEKTIVDPLEAARATARTIAPSRSQLAKRKSADEEVTWESEDETTEHATTALPDVTNKDPQALSHARGKGKKKKARLQGAFPATPQGGKAGERRKWTEEEIAALREGVDKYGVGNWAPIVDEYFADGSRTNINLKDKWRNLHVTYKERPS